MSTVSTSDEIEGVLRPKRYTLKEQKEIQKQLLHFLSEKRFFFVSILFASKRKTSVFSLLFEFIFADIDAGTGLPLFDLFVFFFCFAIFEFSPILSNSNIIQTYEPFSPRKGFSIGREQRQSAPFDIYSRR